MPALGRTYWAIMPALGRTYWARILGMHNDSTVFHYACPVCVLGFYTAPDILVEKPKAFEGKCPPTIYNKILIPRL